MHRISLLTYFICSGHQDTWSSEEVGPNGDASEDGADPGGMDSRYRPSDRQLQTEEERTF